MLPRFVLYGCAGWVMEVGFTGLGAAFLSRDAHATAKTYLWMHPIYGATALGLELLHDRMSAMPRPVRALAYTAVIFGAEFAAGWLLRRLLGRCPWDYGRPRWGVKGLIRLDYAPFWYGAALLFEPAREALLRATREVPRQTPSPGPGPRASVTPPVPASPPPGPRRPSPLENQEKMIPSRGGEQRFRGWRPGGRAMDLTLPFLSASGGP